MVANVTPTLGTYIDIYNELVDPSSLFWNSNVKITNWDTCIPWAQPVWASHVIFYSCMFMAVVYIYVLLAILIAIKKMKRFRSPFYRALLVLAVGDLITIIASSKEGVIQTCVLVADPARHLAWEALGSFLIDIIIAVNIIIAATRLTAVTTLYAANKRRYTLLLDGLLLLSIIWSITIGMLTFYGVEKMVWFPDPSTYRDETFPPFDVFRVPLQYAELLLTFFIYVVAIIRLMMLRKGTNIKDAKREMWMLTLAIIIFVLELVYVYSSNWTGYNVLHWGTAEFNANLNYTARVVTTGITPFLYFIFSTEIRRVCCFWCYSKNNIIFTHTSEIHRYSPSPVQGMK